MRRKRRNGRMAVLILILFIAIVGGLLIVRAYLKKSDATHEPLSVATESGQADALTQAIQSLRDENAQLQEQFLEFKKEMEQATSSSAAPANAAASPSEEAEGYTAQDVYAILAEALKQSDEDVTICLASIETLEEADDAVWVEYQPYALNRRGEYEAVGRSRRHSVQGVRTMADPFSGLALFDMPKPKEGISMQTLMDILEAEQAASEKIWYQIVVSNDTVTGILCAGQ